MKRNFEIWFHLILVVVPDCNLLIHFPININEYFQNCRIVKHDFSYSCPLPEFFNITINIENTPKGIAINASMDIKILLKPDDPAVKILRLGNVHIIRNNFGEGGV
jgi:hypothetical protein